MPILAKIDRIKLMVEVQESLPIRVRFAPSPTGPLHVGGVRTALFNWLFAKQNNGKFILRIEDTDTARSEKRYEEGIMEALQWLGLNWDEGPNPELLNLKEQGKESKSQYIGNYGPYRQSERIEIYKYYLEKLLKENKAYWCYCGKEELEAERQAMLAQGLPPKYSGHCSNLKEPPPGKKRGAIRFRTLGIKIEFKDIIRGKVTFDAGLFGDFIIARNLESPLFNFSGAVDDWEMKISHVIRGEEHLSNTPKQILIQKALGFDTPIYAHIPLILNPDRSKLSKRFAETSVLKYREDGYLPEALINFLVLLGWHPADDREILSLDDLIKEFSIKRVQRAGAVFNQEKLDWLNSQYLKNLSINDLAKKLMPLLQKENIYPEEQFLVKVVEVERERIKKLADFLNIARFFFELPNYEAKMLLWKQRTMFQTKETLQKILTILNDLKNEKDKIERDVLYQNLLPLINQEGRGEILWPLRVAVSGQLASPDPLDIIKVLGLEETKKRIQIAIDKLSFDGNQ